MKKKIFLYLLVFLVLIMPKTVFAEGEPVAQIGSDTYTSLTEAIEHATTANTRITLLTDLTENVTIPNGTSIILDLNNHTLNNNGKKKTVIETKGKLTITNGTVTSNATEGMINVYKGGTLIINDGLYKATDTKQVVYNNGGTVYIGGTAKLEASTSIRATVHNLNDGKIIITGGEIIATNSYAIYNENGSIDIGTKDDEFNNSTPIITGKKYGIIAYTPYNFYDGVVRGETYATGEVTKTGFSPSYKNDPNAAKAEGIEEDSTKKIETISGYSTLYLEVNTSIRSIIKFDPTGGETDVSYKKVYTGNTIGELPTALRIDYTFDGWYSLPTGGDKLTEDTVPTGDATYYAHWTYVDPNTAASVDGVLMSIQDAFATGGNIKLERDVMVGSSLLMNKAATFDLNGHTLSLRNKSIRITEEVTVIDSTDSKAGKITSDADFTVLVGYPDSQSNGKLIHKSGTIEGLGAYGAIRNYETTIIDGGTVQGTATENGNVIYNQKNLIMESGTVYSSNGRAIQVYENSTFTMNGGLVKSDAVNDQTVNLYGNCSATINGGTIEGLNTHTAGIAMFENTTLEVNGGTIKGYDMGIAGNGNEHSGNANIIINDGDISATEGVGMYLPQRNSTTIINGGNISGPTGVEIRASDLYINGGNITATSDTYSVGPNYNGTTSKGSALAVTQHTTQLPINVYINGGNLKGLVPICEANPLSNPDDAIDKVRIIIANGNFISTGTAVIDAENPQTINQLITGGIYTYNPVTYVQDGYGVIKLADNLYEVTKIHNVTIDSDSIDFVTVDDTKYPCKSTVALNVKDKKGFNTIIEIRDTNGNLINVNNNKFMMPNSDVTIKVTYKKDIPVPINPKTYDGIMESTLLFIVSTFGLITIGLCKVKRKDV